MSGKAHVLIADPSAESCSIYQLLLEDYGYEVETAYDGVGCCIKLAGKTPDVLVLEQGLLWGGADGVLARIREDRNVPPVPVILIADDSNSEDRPARFGDPNVTCLHRPFRMIDLVHCLACTAYQTADGIAD